MVRWCFWLELAVLWSLLAVSQACCAGIAQKCVVLLCRKLAPACACVLHVDWPRGSHCVHACGSRLQFSDCMSVCVFLRGRLTPVQPPTSSCISLKGCPFSKVLHPVPVPATLAVVCLPCLPCAALLRAGGAGLHLPTDAPDAPGWQEPPSAHSSNRHTRRGACRLGGCLLC